MGLAVTTVREIAALYVRTDSIYKTLPQVVAWDSEMDARLWPGNSPVVAHPPCAQWSRLRALARNHWPTRMCGPLAVDQVRAFGGVLEHPNGSCLWTHCAMPKPGEPQDRFGGWTLDVDQFLWGHQARKATWLYIVGVERQQLPEIPHRWGYPSHCVGTSGRKRNGNRSITRLPELAKADRERTPPEFAAWLVELARRSQLTRAEAVA